MALTSLNISSLPDQILILAPQGAESQAIAKGLRASPGKNPPQFALQSIPVGAQALTPFLVTLGQTWDQKPKPQALLVMGVTGSLQPKYDIGQPVILTAAKVWPPQAFPEIFPTDLALSQGLITKIAHHPNSSFLPIPWVKGITTNQVICQGTEKQALAQQSGADVVDMENTTILKFAQSHHLPVAIIRVVSDSVNHDLPDLANIYDTQGNLKPWRLTTRFARRPLAAIRLIRGSLLACDGLQQLARVLGANN